VDAFVYLQVRPGHVEDVVVQLQATRGVRAAVTVIGDWDVMVATHGPDLQAIAETVVRRIARVDGVERTVTAPVVPGDVLGFAGGGLRTPVPMQQPGDACYVHIRAEPGAAARLLEALAALEDVSAVAMVAGEYDVIAEIPYPWEQAARVIVDRILTLPGVLATKTLISLPHLEPEDEDRDQFSAWS
jgi:DNA-binding Lrp family transcriptional regulator